MEHPGDLLARAIRAASHVVLVAPFVKCRALARLLAERNRAATVELFTRWLPEDVASGVCDLEVIDLTADGSLTSVSVHPRLHAKLYRFDSSAYVGSANLTMSGLGWSEQPNLEVLVASHSDACGDFETTLRRESILATEALRRSVADAAAALRSSMPNVDQVCLDDPAASARASAQEWWPSTRQPESLFEFYSGVANASAAGLEQMTCDLRALQVPTGLSREAFNAYVRAKLHLQKWHELLNSFTSTPRRFGEMRAFVAEHAAQRDPRECWQTSARWLLYYFPGEYVMEARPFSEVFRRT